MKKYISFILAAILCFGTVSCGESTSSEQAPAQATEQETVEQSVTQTTTTATTTTTVQIPNGSPIDYISFNWDYCSQSGGKTYANITATNNSTAIIYGSIRVVFDDRKTVIVNLPTDGVQPGTQKIKSEVNDDIPGGYNDVLFFDNSLSFYNDGSATTPQNQLTPKTLYEACEEIHESVKSDNIQWGLNNDNEYVGYIYKPGIREIAERCIPAGGNYSVDSFEIWLTLKNSCKNTTKMIDELFATEGYPEITATLYVLDDTMCDGFPGEGEDYYYIMKCSNGLCYYDITDQ